MHGNRHIDRLGAGQNGRTTVTRPRMRHPLLLLSSLAVIAVAAPAAAVDRYDDVSADATHAGAIGEVADAGVTAGCDADSFCPGDAVSRQQMASFLARTGSRATFDANVVELSSANGYDGVPASVTVPASGTPGGTRNVTLTGSVSVYSQGAVTSCPCELEAFVYRDSGNQPQGPSSWTQLPATTSGSGRVATSLPVTWMAEIPSGTTETFRIAVFLNDGSPSGVRAEASLSAVVTPF